MNKPGNRCLEENTIKSEEQNKRLPDDLSEPNTISWLYDWIDLNKFRDENEFLKFVSSAWFDKVYYINVNFDDIEKYVNIKSVYNLLERYKELIRGWRLHLVIFRRWKDSYQAAKQETDKVIWEYADEWMTNTEEYRKDLIEALKRENIDVSEMWDEVVREKLIKSLEDNPWFTRVFSDWARYKYLIWWYSKFQQIETWERYINALKNNWVDMIEIK